MKAASDRHVMFSYRYYKSMLPGEGGVANLLKGLYQKAAAEALKRCLIRLDLKTQLYVETANEPPTEQ